MSGEALVLTAAALMAGSGLPGLALGRHSAFGQWLETGLGVLGAGLGVAGALAAFGAGPGGIRLPWLVLGDSFRVNFAVRVDPLSVVFLLPVCVVAATGSLYGQGYWNRTNHPETARNLRLFFGLLTGSMVLLVVARNAILFLFAWEVMALAGFFLVATEERTDPAVREAGWIYLAATHTSTLCLVPLFALLYSLGGSFDLDALPEGVAVTGVGTAVLILALLGFGLKAGIMPLHLWLPTAHAMAPSHVSALLSGVVIKMGIYGLVRVTSLFPLPPLWWGGLVLVLGVTSGVLGVAFAVGQHDVKRLLAYHSIENIGIIVMGLGLALLGRSLGRADLILLGMAGALLHVWNHALFKSLLFFSAGSVLHATHTRDIDHLGGLAKTMPLTALAFVTGAVAICGLPPLNGFVSELFIYLGLFTSLLPVEGHGSFPLASLAAPALALIGALALACFVKVFAGILLGTARTEHAAHAHESGWAMTVPMAILGGGCLFLGLAPGVAAPLLEQGARTWAPELPSATTLASLAPLNWVSTLGAALLAGVALGWLLLWGRLRTSEVTAAGTWDCGFAAPTARIQYTSSSFAQMLVGLFRWALWPRTHPPGRMGLFPGRVAFHSDVPDVVLDRAVVPAFHFTAWLLSWLRWVQRGGVQLYLLYVFATLLALLLWTVKGNW